MNDDIENEEAELVAGLVRWIDIAETYVVIIGGHATTFTSERLEQNLPVLFVGHVNEKELRPIRDLSILHVVKDRPGHNEIANSDAHLLVEEGVAVSKMGAEITLEDIYSAAKMAILARLDEEA